MIPARLGVGGVVVVEEEVEEVVGEDVVRGEEDEGEGVARPGGQAKPL